MKYFENLEKFRFIYAENMKQSIINWHKFSTKLSRRTLTQTFQDYIHNSESRMTEGAAAAMKVEEGRKIVLCQFIVR